MRDWIAGVKLLQPGGKVDVRIDACSRVFFARVARDDGFPNSPCDGHASENFIECETLLRRVKSARVRPRDVVYEGEFASSRLYTKVHKSEPSDIKIAT